MQDESKVEMAFVVKSQHDAQNRVYRYSTHEIPAHKAHEQLSRPDDKRNYHFKGARYATEEEIFAYNKEQGRITATTKKIKDQEPEETEIVESTNVKQPKATKAKA